MESLNLNATSSPEMTGLMIIRSNQILRRKAGEESRRPRPTPTHAQSMRTQSPQTRAVLERARRQEFDALLEQVETHATERELFAMFASARARMAEARCLDGDILAPVARFSSARTVAYLAKLMDRESAARGDSTPSWISTEGNGAAAASAGANPIVALISLTFDVAFSLASLFSKRAERQADKQPQSVGPSNTTETATDATSILSVTCSGCRATYELGATAAVVTIESIGLDFGSTVLGGSEEDPDLVAPYASGRVPSAETRRGMLPLIEAKIARTPRFWKCRPCGSINRYPW